MCGPDSARCTESISTPAISSASSIAFLIESTAASRFTTTPRRMPRDSATPMPTTSKPSPSSNSPTTAVTLDVPTSSPTTYRSFRATRPPGSAAFSGFCPHGFAMPRGGTRDRANVNPVVEPQVYVIDLRHALAQRGRQVQVRLDALQELVVAQLDDRGIAVQNHRCVVQI